MVSLVALCGLRELRHQLLVDPVSELAKLDGFVVLALSEAFDGLVEEPRRDRLGADHLALEPLLRAQVVERVARAVGGLENRVTAHGRLLSRSAISSSNLG